MTTRRWIMPSLLVVAAALAWRLGIDGFGEAWAELPEGDAAWPTGREKLRGMPVEWVRHRLPDPLVRGAAQFADPREADFAGASVCGRSWACPCA